jgi:hypothetical protein
VNVEVFVRRCAVCGHEVHEPWGPETLSLTQARLVEHVNGHSDAEIREWAMPLLVAKPEDGVQAGEKA